MDMLKSFRNELTAEAANTRKMLAQVPMDQADYKPHEKSMTLGRLATHVAELPGWITMTLHTEELDFNAGDYKPVFAKSIEELLAMHDANVAKALEALSNATEEDLLKTWTLRNGDHIILQLPKVAVLRNMCMNHFVHHRGQLSVYLRLNDVPFPGMYGPSADEQLYAAAAAAAN